MVEGAEERGFIDPAQLTAFVTELELNDDEVEELTRELERAGLEIGQPAAPAANGQPVEAPKEEAKEKQEEPAPEPEVTPTVAISGSDVEVRSIA